MRDLCCEPSGGGFGQQVDDEADHEVLAGHGALGDEQRQRCQRLGIEPVFDALLLEKEQEQQGTDALVTVGEGVVLDDETEQMRRPGLTGAVEGLAEHCLFDIAENGFQGVAARVPE